MQMLRHMALALSGLFLAVGLVACAPPSTDRALQDPPGPKRVSATRSIEAHFVGFEPGLAAIPVKEQRALLAFLREIDAGKRDQIAVLNDARMPTSLARERRDNVHALLRKSGFRDVSVASGEPVQTSWAEAQGRHSVLVQVLHYSAHVRGCPDFSRPSLGGFENFTSSNFGCATAQNLEAMVAEPRDLVEGRDAGPADGTRMGQSIKRYREDEVKTGDEDATAATATTDE